jgi:predicted Zn-dependent protease
MHSRFRHLFRICAFFICVFSFLPVSDAQARVGIRDAEIEELIEIYTAPVFEAAGLLPGNVEVNILGDLKLNAFVANGQQLYLNTGIILASKTPNELIGVIAHEAGHIAGGHLARGRLAIDQARIPLIVSTLLGIGAAVAGAGEAGAAIIAGGTQIGTGNYLKFSRAQESASDQAAANYLEATGQSANGLLEVLGMLGNQRLLDRGIENSYALTHPLSRERIAALQQHVQRSSFTKNVDSSALQIRHDRMRAKLSGFLDTPVTVLRKYPETNTSIPARYARAAAFHRQGNPDRALKEINSLISELPQDAYFHEVKGQILYENGRVDGAIEAYRQAVQYAPGQPLIQLALGQVLVATGKPALIQEGVIALEAGTRVEQDYPSAWHSLAVAYDELGETGRAQLATAERLAILGFFDDARIHAERALPRLPHGSPSWLRASDIMSSGKPGKLRGQN